MSDDLEILVIDNHSDDESIAFLRGQLKDIPSVRIIEHGENRGFAVGNNRALRFAHGECILIINPDNVLPKNGLKSMLTYLQQHDDVGVVGPALVYPDGTIRASARPFPTILDLVQKRVFPALWQRTFQRTFDDLCSEESVDVDWLVGACLLLRADLLQKLGGFDERYFLFFEDIDLCRRIHNIGKRVVYLPKVHVQDRKGRLSGSSIFSLLKRQTTRIHLMSALRYFWKWRS